MFLIKGDSITLPHRYIPNQVVKISRGTLNRQPLIVPDKKGELSQTIQDIFIQSAKVCEIEILALLVEPFGYEAIILDRNMRRSKFMQMVNQAISLAVKKKIVHYESLWSNQKPGNLAILDIETLRREIVRVCTTPVRAGYVRRIEDWELPHFSPEDWGVEMDADNGNESRTEPLCTSSRGTQTALGGKTRKLEVALEIENKRKSASRRSPQSCESNRSQKGRTLEGFNLEATPQINEISWCPGLTKLLAGKGSIVSMFAKIDDLKVGLNAEIGEFEREEKRRRKRVLGIVRCRRKSTFLKQKSSKGNLYIDHLREVLCVSLDRLEAIRKFMQQFYKNYNAALVCFIRTRKASFPYGVLKMRTLFRADYGPPQVEDPFVFQF